MALGGAGLIVAVAVVTALPPPPPTKGPPQPPIVPALSLFVPGLLLVVGSVRTVALGWQIRSWPRVGGVIAEVRSIGRPYLYVLCHYAVEDVEHAVDEIRYGFEGTDRLQRGAPLGVRYDPADPSRATLEPALRPGPTAALAVGLVVVGLSASLLALP